MPFDGSRSLTTTPLTRMLVHARQQLTQGWCQHRARQRGSACMIGSLAISDYDAFVEAERLLLAAIRDLGHPQTSVADRRLNHPPAAGFRTQEPERLPSRRRARSCAQDHIGHATSVAIYFHYRWGVGALAAPCLGPITETRAHAQSINTGGRVMPPLAAESTTFTLDNMGRFVCNTLQEARDSTAQA